MIVGDGRLLSPLRLAIRRHPPKVIFFKPETRQARVIHIPVKHSMTWVACGMLYRVCVGAC